LFVFDHAPLGFGSIAAHGHADALSVWLHWGEEAVLVDAGTFRYHAGGNIRDLLRGTLAHNTLAVDGQDQSVIAGPFTWSRHAAVRLISATPSRVVAEHHGYAARFGVVHRRAVAFEHLVYVLEDHVEAKPGASGRNWRLGFTFAPGTRIEAERRSAAVATPGDRRLRVVTESSAAATAWRWELEGAAYSPTFNKMGSAPRVTLTGDIAPGP